MDDASIAAAVASLGPVPAGPASALARLLGGLVDEIEVEMDRQRVRRNAGIADRLAWLDRNRDAIAAAAYRPPGPTRAPF
jgi:hypothetical protein